MVKLLLLQLLMLLGRKIAVVDTPVVTCRAVTYMFHTG